MSARIAFFVPGRPRSTQTGSIVRAGGRSFPLRRGAGWSTICGLIARDHAPDSPLTGPLAADLLFLFRRPKKPTQPYPSRADVDDLAKGLLDSLQGVIYDDDKQLVDVRLRKRWTLAAEGVRVEIQDWSPEYRP